MKRLGRTYRNPLVAFAILVAFSAGAFAVQEQQPTRAQFMRQKLDFGKNVLEGLALENYDLIEKNARSLKRMSMGAEWEVPGIPNVEEYLPYTAEFQRLCDEIVKAAKNRNIDGATLGYVRLTTNCVNCHKFVRGDR